MRSHLRQAHAVLASTILAILLAVASATLVLADSGGGIFPK